MSQLWFQSVFESVFEGAFESVFERVRVFMRACVRALPRVSQLVFREHCPLSRSIADSCSSDWLSLAMMPQDDRQAGESLLYDWLSAESRRCRSSASESCCCN